MTRLLFFLIVGLLAGWLASKVMRGHGLGLAGNLVVGVIGALIGGPLLRAVGLMPFGLPGSLIAAFLGAVVLLALIRWLQRV